jgi:hypothetical protein
LRRLVFQLQQQALIRNLTGGAHGRHRDARMVGGKAAGQRFGRFTVDLGDVLGQSTFLARGIQ